MKISCLLNFKVKSVVFWLCFLFLLFSRYEAAKALGESENLSPAPKKYALLIGIDKYGGEEFKPLQGAKNDVELMKAILTGHFHCKSEDITVLTDEQATHTAIKAAFQKLSDTVKKGDFVYIHYSGHGSYTCDLNGDESPNWRKDSTWVSYKDFAIVQSDQNPHSDRSLPPASPGKDCAEIRELQKKESLSPSPPVSPELLNNYDILDDEIHSWLSSLGQKTEHVIFVSDSCHSGTVTRGEAALATRGVPMDFRPHPLGMVPVQNIFLPGLRITACRDNEKASEYRKEDKIHGLFTWFWTQSLEQARPDETWGNLYKRTCAKVRQYAGGRQHPQIEGEQKRLIFGGSFADRTAAIPIRYVSHDGLTAKIDAGSLLGVTRGSVYRKADIRTKNKEYPTIEITRTYPTWSQGRIRGTFKVGDLLLLEHYQHKADPMKIFVRADLKEDQLLADKIKKAVSTLPAYEITENQGKSDFVIQILRPEKDNHNQYVYSKENDSLPRSCADQNPECWILTPDEALYQEKLKISMADDDKGTKVLCDNLAKIARVKNLVSLSSAPGQISPVQLSITIWRKSEPGNPVEKVQETSSIWPERIEAGGILWQQERTVTAREPEQFDLKADRLLTFSIHNTSDKAFFIYLLNITSDGEIVPFYPTPYQNKEYAKVEANGIRKVEEVTLWIDQPGYEYIRLIATLEPIDIYVLEQKGYRKRSEERKLNPLEALLSTKAGHSLRGRNLGPISTAAWTTVLGAFRVTP
ncbi:caspase family protein [Desulfonema magnum]|nr:caspase family protein [Desulfonema magnum]